MIASEFVSALQLGISLEVLLMYILVLNMMMKIPMEAKHHEIVPPREVLALRAREYYHWAF